eukprot:335399-Chlamydomonas_euryale.AAC.1
MHPVEGSGFRLCQLPRCLAGCVRVQRGRARSSRPMSGWVRRGAAGGSQVPSASAWMGASGHRREEPGPLSLRLDGCVGAQQEGSQFPSAYALIGQKAPKRGCASQSLDRLRKLRQRGCGSQRVQIPPPDAAVQSREGQAGGWQTSWPGGQAR